MECESKSTPYISLVKKCILRTIFPDSNMDHEGTITPYDADKRRIGLLYPTEAFSMVGELRLQAVEHACRQVVADRVPGDFVECGVWRGGCAILMRAMIEDMSTSDRKVWLFDSFEGAPKPTWPQDASDTHWQYGDIFAVGEEEVRLNFSTFDLLDDLVEFRKGWFAETVPNAPHPKSIAVLRLDGDLYESIKVCLDHFYSRVRRGGFVLIDDYYCIESCQQAVDDFRRDHGIASPLIATDWNGCYWQVD